MTTLDVMIPHYGPLERLQEAVASVLAQDDPDWRLTVVDDCYPDPAVTAWFGTLDDPRVRYVRNEVNLGSNRNFQRCLDLATAELLVMVGCDDLLLPGYVRTVRAAFADHPEATVVQPGVEVVDDAGRPAATLVDTTKRRLYAPPPGVHLLSGEELATSLMRGNWLYFPSLCWRSAAAKEVGFRPGLDVVQDLALMIDLVCRGAVLLVVPTPCFRYRRHAGSESSWRAASGGRFAEERSYYAQTAAQLEARGWPAAARTARRHVSSRLHALVLVPAALRGGDRSAVRSLVGHAVAR